MTSTYDPIRCRQCRIIVGMARNLSAGLCDTCWRELHPVFEPLRIENLFADQRASVVDKCFTLHERFDWGKCVACKSSNKRYCPRHERPRR